MVGRIIIQPARIIVSKSGVAVSTSMADSDKIFDSDWNWSGVLLEAKGANDPGGGDWTVNFNRDYGYVPCVVARMYASAPYAIPWDGPKIDSPVMTGGTSGRVCPFVYSNRIVFPRNYSTGGSFSYGYIEYEVYGVD